jgi:hypothetical protein
MADASAARPATVRGRNVYDSWQSFEGATVQCQLDAHGLYTTFQHCTQGANLLRQDDIVDTMRLQLNKPTIHNVTGEFAT